MDAPVYHLKHVVRSKEEMEDFNGPLDLILHLLSKNKMEIKDIQIALILDQYIEWMDRRKEMDLEVASEFVTMAAHLVYIKTRMLLSIQDEEATSEMEQLIASLEEHQRHENFDRIKQIIPTLDRRYRGGSRLSDPAAGTSSKGSHLPLRASAGGSGKRHACRSPAFRRGAGTDGACI